MVHLNTEYAGLKLKSPVIIGSSGLTNSAAKNKSLEAAGVGAVVVKSLFEEQIMALSDSMLQGSDYPEAIDYIRNYVESNQVNDYLSLIQASKAECMIPIIASINCYTDRSWESFASQIESAGADALELNLFSITTRPDEPDSPEEMFIEVLKKVKQRVHIPVIVKIGKYYSNIPYFVSRLYQNGANAVVLFNRFYQPDIDVHAMKIVSGQVFSAQGANFDTLRWTALVSGKVPGVDLSASTGNYDWEDVVKCILAGASTVQLCSAVYKSGLGIIPRILDGVRDWMSVHGFQSIDEFKGRLNASQIADPTLYERTQFMKYFSNQE